jgi:hypothetical protein
MTVTMVNNVFAYGPDGKVFFAAVNFPGSWADGTLTAKFLHTIKRKIGEYKICVDQGFPRSGEAYGTLTGPVTKRAADVFIETSGSAFCESATCIRRFVRRVSGGCVDCREPSPAGRSASQETTFSGGWSLRPSS